VQQQLSSLFLRSFYSEEKARRKGEETTVPTADPIPKPLNLPTTPPLVPSRCPLARRSSFPSAIGRSPPLTTGICLDLPSGKQFDSSVNVIPATLDSSIPWKATN
jgi:hypothetical protein